MSRACLVLAPEVDVERADGGFNALGPEPWLGLSGPSLVHLAGRFITLTYAASLWDAPARPVIRFWRRDGPPIDRIAAAPVAGCGTWTGRIPPETTRVSISPTHHSGRFDFEVLACRRRRWPLLLVEGVFKRPRSTRSAVLTKLIGWAPESDVNLAWAIGATPLHGFPAWWRARSRPADLAGLDRPRFAWNEAPPITLIVRANGDARALGETLRSLRAQVFPRWVARVLDARPPDGPADPRVTFPSSLEAGDVSGQDVGTQDLGTQDLGTQDLGTQDLGNCQFGDGLACVLCAGDRLLPTALAIVAEQARRHPDGTIFYGDTIVRRGTGAPGGMIAATPLFRPGWSPRLQRSLGYLDGGWLFARRLSAWPAEARAAFFARGALPACVVDGLGRDAVRPLRRFLGDAAASPPAAAPETPRDASAAISVTTTRATATIIIPTRDHPALLSRLVASIRARSPAGRSAIIVVDNGSVEPATLAAFEVMRGLPDVRLLARPGPFNFSAMCNEAAAMAPSDVLVFLNDDTEVLSDGWLDRLCGQALDPATGAVGAKLTYPDGRIQHVGVLVGMGESAGHFGALAPGDDPGWARRNLAAHEVSAVTGACLAVAREKFEAVGGFDAVHLPIELSDIDLCLKLNARGWQTIVDPAVRIMHEESASRGGATLRRLTVYDRERAVFVERWRHVLRDDPVFHPGLSLYSWRAALG